MSDLLINYPMMEEMSRLFREAAKQIEETNGEMQQIANALDEGALVGETGDALADALRRDLNQSLQNLFDKFNELVGDIDGVIAVHRDGETSAASRFR